MWNWHVKQTRRSSNGMEVTKETVCKYALRALCGYGMVFYGFLKNKNKNKQIVCPVLLIFLSSMKCAQRSLEFK